MHSLQRAFTHLHIGGHYRIEKKIESTAATILYIHNYKTSTRLCLKLWHKCEEQNELYDTNEPQKCIEYLLTGWKVNPLSAPGVYLGIVPVRFNRNKRLTLGKLIHQPNRKTLNPKQGYKYAIVMKRLQESWILDDQLSEDKFGNKEGMVWLGQKIADMHFRIGTQNTEKLPPEIGNFHTLQRKLRLNIHEFEKALVQYPDKENGYTSIGEKMQDALLFYAPSFQQRYQAGCIKRCHGDLKTTNLWIRPMSIHQAKGALPNTAFELLALDCVDFLPEFYYIDILSDIAMLIADIYAHLLHHSHTVLQAQQLTDIFLTNYLHAMREEEQEIKPLLTYYITEKAMICAYMWVNFDKRPLQINGKPSLGTCYFEVAQIHMHKLEQMMKHQEAYISYSATIPDATTLGEQASIGRHSG